jgi:REP element-mobilizing transposase RayT
MDKRLRDRPGPIVAAPRPFWPTLLRANRRLDRSLYEVPDQPCFFTIRTYGTSELFARPKLATLAQQCLLESQQRYGCQVEVYCVMPDHVHVIVTPMIEGRSSLTFVDRFKGVTSFRMGRSGWFGKVW